MIFFLGLATLVVAINAYTDQSAWIEFKAKHFREYNLVEEDYRFKIFQKTLRQIEEHNAKYEKDEKSYFLKVTKFADWTDEEFNSLLNEQALSRPQFDDLEIFTANSEGDIPESVDWRDKNAVLPVKDQGNCGACWTFSSTGALEGQLVIHKNISVPLSNQELIDCARSFGNKGCKGGFQDKAYFYIKKNGIASDADYPYVDGEGTCNNQNTERFVQNISAVMKVAEGEGPLAVAVANVGPIAVSVDASYWRHYGGGIFDDINCGYTINHAVVDVGYAPKYWILKNSWGTDWGENGYLRLIRGVEQCGIWLFNYVPYL